MLRENERIYNSIITVLDIILSLIAFYAAYSFRVINVSKQALYSV